MSDILLEILTSGGGGRFVIFGGGFRKKGGSDEPPPGYGPGSCIFIFVRVRGNSID